MMCILSNIVLLYKIGVSSNSTSVFVIKVSKSLCKNTYAAPTRLLLFFFSNIMWPKSLVHALIMANVINWHCQTRLRSRYRFERRLLCSSMSYIAKRADEEKVGCLVISKKICFAQYYFLTSAFNNS